MSYEIRIPWRVLIELDEVNAGYFYKYAENKEYFIVHNDQVFKFKAEYSPHDLEVNAYKYRWEIVSVK